MVGERAFPERKKLRAKTKKGGKIMPTGGKKGGEKIRVNFFLRFSLSFGNLRSAVIITRCERGKNGEGQKGGTMPCETLLVVVEITQRKGRGQDISNPESPSFPNRHFKFFWLCAI